MRKCLSVLDEACGFRAVIAPDLIRCEAGERIDDFTETRVGQAYGGLVLGV
jgi:hypothetical protein